MNFHARRFRIETIAIITVWVQSGVYDSRSVCTQRNFSREQFFMARSIRNWLFRLRFRLNVLYLLCWFSYFLAHASLRKTETKVATMGRNKHRIIFVSFWTIQCCMMLIGCFWAQPVYKAGEVNWKFFKLIDVECGCDWREMGEVTEITKGKVNGARFWR